VIIWTYYSYRLCYYFSYSVWMYFTLRLLRTSILIDSVNRGDEDSIKHVKQQFADWSRLNKRLFVSICWCFSAVSVKNLARHGHKTHCCKYVVTDVRYSAVQMLDVINIATVHHSWGKSHVIQYCVTPGTLELEILSLCMSCDWLCADCLQNLVNCYRTSTRVNHCYTE
jgi:hypothetical protein